MLWDSVKNLCQTTQWPTFSCSETFEYPNDVLELSLGVHWENTFPETARSLFYNCLSIWSQLLSAVVSNHRWRQIKGEVSTQEIHTAKLSFISLLSQETPIEESFCSNLDISKQILRESGRTKVEQKRPSQQAFHAINQIKVPMVFHSLTGFVVCREVPSNSIVFALIFFRACFEKVDCLTKLFKEFLFELWNDKLLWCTCRQRDSLLSQVCRLFRQTRGQAFVVLLCKSFIYNEEGTDIAILERTRVLVIRLPKSEWS